MRTSFVQVIQSTLPFLKPKKRTFTASYTKAEYFDRYGFAETHQQLKNLFKQSKAPIFSSSEPILFQNLPFGTTFRNVVKVMGKPQHEFTGISEVSGHSAFVFKSNVGAVGVTYCLHFLHGSLFVGQCVVRHPAPGDIAFLKDMLLQTYEPAMGGDSAGAYFTIIDGAGNRVTFDHSLYLRINYVPGDQIFK